MNHIFKIVRFSSSLWPYYAAVSFFSIAIALMGLLQPLLSGWAIDELRKGAEADTTYLAWIVVIIFALDFGTTIISNLSGYIGDQMSARLLVFLSKKYYEHLLRLPQSYFDTELTGKIINQLNRSIAQISNFMQMMSNNFLQFIFSTFLSLGIIAFYSWQIAALLFLLYPIYIWMTVRNSNTWQKYQEQKNEQSDIAQGRFTEAIQQIRVVKSYLQEKAELGFFMRHVNKALQINRPQSKFWHVQDVKRRTILNVIFFGVYLLIFQQASRGQFSPGAAVTLILYAMQIRIPIFTISFLVENTQRAMSDSKDYFALLDVDPGAEQTGSHRTLSIEKADIRFENVTFGYDDEHTVLSDLQLQIPAGTSTALVGESGEGKTTLTNLLLRLYPPTNGRILIDNKDISQYNIASLRNVIGVVFQDASLFSGTIKDNIRYGNSEADDAAVIKAAKAANAHDFISDFKDGYNTQIGERGLKLSGGQKQRIAIARAILKDAPILILDEATSSLDSKSEQQVQAALETLMKDRTVIIIAHRLSTIENVDQIVTLKNGKIDEVGSPQKLAKTKGIYHELLKLQQGTSKNKKAGLKRYELG